MADERISYIANKLHVYKDYPKKGVDYQDIFSVLRDAEAVKVVFELIREKALTLRGKIDCVAGIESRGFLFAPTIALEIGAAFEPIRKANKLPGEKLSIDYTLEYGESTAEIQKEGFESKKKVLIVDDLLATGGTLKAAVDLINTVESEVVECFVLFELAHLEGRKQLPGVLIESLITL